MKPESSTQKLKKTNAVAIQRKKSKRTVLQKQLDQDEQNAHMASLRELTSGVIHEINNSLAVISGNSDILQILIENNQLTQENVAQCNQKVKKSLEKIDSITKSFRSLIRRESQDSLRCDPNK